MTKGLASTNATSRDWRHGWQCHCPVWHFNFKHQAIVAFNNCLMNQKIITSAETYHRRWWWVLHPCQSHSQDQSVKSDTPVARYTYSLCSEIVLFALSQGSTCLCVGGCVGSSATWWWAGEPGKDGMFWSLSSPFKTSSFSSSLSPLSSWSPWFSSPVSTATKSSLLELWASSVNSAACNVQRLKTRCLELESGSCTLVYFEMEAQMLWMRRMDRVYPPGKVCIFSHTTYVDQI